MNLNNHQAREAARICADRAERFAELTVHEQLTIAQRAREVREENARRAAKAVH